MPVPGKWQAFPGPWCCRMPLFGLPNPRYRERRNGGQLRRLASRSKKLDRPTGGTPNVTPTIPFERRGRSPSALAAYPAAAQDTVKIGLIVPMTGQQASTGKQIDAAVKLYQAQHGTTVAGKKIEVILKDDGAVPDNTKRIAQELIVNDKVNFIAGFGVTPAALAAAPLATQAKVPLIVMAAGTSIITERSPYIARTSFTLAQSSVIIADWAMKNNIKKVVTMVSDYAPGADAEKSFSDTLQGRRRRDRGGDPHAARQPGLRAVPAARRRRQARRAVHLRAVRPGRHLREAVRRARPRQGRHQADRPRRRDRRRPAPQHGRRGDRHRDGAHVFGRASLADEQGLCRGLREGQQLPPELHVGRRL